MPRLIALLALTAACGPAAAPPPDAEAPPPAASDAPIAGLSPAELAAFEAGDALFEVSLFHDIDHAPIHQVTVGIVAVQAHALPCLHGYIISFGRGDSSPPKTARQKL